MYFPPFFSKNVKKHPIWQKLGAFPILFSIVILKMGKSLRATQHFFFLAIKTAPTPRVDELHYGGNLVKHPSRQCQWLMNEIPPFYTSSNKQMFFRTLLRTLLGHRRIIKVNCGKWPFLGLYVTHYSKRYLKGCGMGPWLVLVSSCFRKNVVATCKIGSFLCNLDNLLQKT